MSNIDFDYDPIYLDPSTTKAQLLQLILDEVIGADKQPNDNHIDKEWGDGYSCVVCEKDYRQNQLRAEQRQAARKLFGMEEK